MIFKMSKCYRLKWLSLALIVFCVCIQRVHLADDDSESGVSPKDVEKSDDSDNSATEPGDKSVGESLHKESTNDDKPDDDSDKLNSDKASFKNMLDQLKKHVENATGEPLSGPHLEAHDTGKALGSKSIEQELHKSITAGKKVEEEESTGEPDIVSTTEEEEKASEEPPSETPPAEVPPESKFVVRDSDGKICSLAKFNAVFDIAAKNKAIVHLPKNATVRGKCEGNERRMKFSWAKANFTMTFSKINTEDVDQWALTGAELKYRHKDAITASAKNLTLFKTSLGYSYACPSTRFIHLKGTSDATVTVSLDDIQLQPFDVKDDKFSEEQRCDEDVSVEGPNDFEPVRDETVPLAVGLTFAILTLIIVLGFSIHRAYTMRKVDYNGME